MGEGGDGLGLTLEASQGERVTGDGLRQHLDGHLPLEPCVLRAVHFAHSPRAERSDDLVGTESCVGV